MSKQVDERVVSMQFDNQHFEKNVNTTMSTLDKLKQSLNLTGASKGLENVNAAAGKVNMSGLASGVEAVRMKFSALEVMGVTALANLTNSAVNAGKRIVSALTIDPVTTGFNEYELKMDSIKTIVASTGEELTTVNKYLEELNEYSDQTIYSFADMTQNIGKFTNAGVKLEDAVMAIKGISNEAAVSGANANEASRAMYNFAQALSSGYVKLIDWKSIENANMATVEFKQQLIDTAVALGTVSDAGDGMYQTLEGNAFNATQGFNEVFQDQWMTSEVLIETLKRYADETTDIGKKAKAAAQDVTKFSQVFDILKETAQSGWAKTWELIVGDLEQAKAWLTPFTNFLSGIIDGMSDFRNRILEIALGAKFDWLLEPLSGIKNTIKGIKEPFEEVTKTLEDYNRVVNEVIRGKWGHTQKRWDALTEAGYDWITVQNMVNEKLGNSKRRQTDFVIGQSSMAKATEESTEANTEFIVSLTKMTDAELETLGLTADQIDAIEMLKAEADRLGLSVEDFIKNIDKIDGRWVLFESFKNIWKAISQIFNSIKGAWEEIFPPKSVEEIGEALYGVIAAFHKFTLGLSLSDDTTKNLTRTFKGLFAIIDVIATIFGGGFKLAFKAVSALLKYFNLNILDVTAYIGDALVTFRDWFNAVFDVDHIVAVLIFKLKILFDRIQDWIQNNELLNKGLEAIKEFLKPIITYVKQLWHSLKQTENIGEVFSIISHWALTAYESVIAWAKSNEKLSGTFKVIKSALQPVIDGVKDWIKGLKETDNIPKYIIQGLVNGLKNGIPKVINGILDLGKMLIDKFCELLGIHSPSTVFIMIGAFIIAGLIGGLTGGAGKVFEAIKNVGSGLIDAFNSVDPQEFFTSVGNFFKGIFTNIKDFLSKIDWGSLLALGVTVGLVFAVKKIADVLELLAQPLEIVQELTEHLNMALDGLTKYLNAKAFEARANGVMKLATAIAILAAAIFLLASVDDIGKLWGAVGAIFVLAVIMVGLAIAVEKLSKVDIDIKEGKVSGMNTSLLGIAAALLVLVVIAKIIGTMDLGQLAQGFIGLVAIMGAMLGFVALYGVISKKFSTMKVDTLGVMLLQLAGTIILLAVAAKMLGGMSEVELIKATAGLLVLSGIMALLLLISKIANTKKIGVMLVQMAGTMALLAITAKIIGNMEWEEMAKAALGLGYLVGIMALLMLITKIGNAKKVGEMLLGIAGAMAILAITAKIIGSMEWHEMGRAAVGLIGLLGAVFVLVLITKTIEKDAPKIAATLIALAGAVAVLAIVAVLLGHINFLALLQGCAGIIALAFAMRIMIQALNGANNIMASLIVMTVAIVAMAAAVAALSLIDPGRLVVATLCLGGLMALFALLINQSKNIAGSTATLITMTVALGILGVVLWLVGGLPWQQSLAAAAALATVLLALAVSMKIISTIPKISLTSLMVMVTGVAILGVLIALLSLIPIKSTLGAVAALSVMLLSLSASMFIISKIKKVNVGVILALLATATALVLLANVISVIGGMAGGQVLQAVLALAGVLGLLAIGLNLMNGTLAGSAALLIAAAALNVLAPALIMLGAMPMADIGKSLLVLAGAFVIMGAAGLLLGPLVPVIFALSAALVVFGLGVIALGAGMSLIGNGLILMANGFMMLVTTMATGSPVIASGLGLIVTTLANMIPYIAQQIGQGIIALCQTLMESAPVIGETVLVLATTVVNTLVNLIPMFVEGVVKLLDSILATLAEYTPSIAQSAFDILIACLEAIANNISKVVQTAIDVVCGFIDGIAQSIPQVIQSAYDLMISFINGLADGIRNNNQAVIDAVNNLMDAIVGAIVAWFDNVVTKGGELIGKLGSGISGSVDKATKAIGGVITDMIEEIGKFVSKFKEAAKDLIDGFIKGIKDSITDVCNAAAKMAEEAWNAVCSFFSIKSPSRKMMEVGRYVDEGFAVGLTKYSKNVVRASEGMANSAMTAMSNTIAKISDAVNGDIDAQPTIRPVLDLSGVEAGAGAINGLFNNPTVGVMSNVRSINTMMNRQNGANSELVSAISDLKNTLNNRPGGNTYNVNGINYSEGDDVAQALETIIRAARVERRA